MDVNDDENEALGEAAVDDILFPERWRSTAEMIDDCFRHQHPEAYGREQVPQVAVPWELECGRDHMTPSQSCAVAEEPMGNPDAVSLDAS